MLDAAGKRKAPAAGWPPQAPGSAEREILPQSERAAALVDLVLFQQAAPQSKRMSCMGNTLDSVQSFLHAFRYARLGHAVSSWRRPLAAIAQQHGSEFRHVLWVQHHAQRLVLAIQMQQPSDE